MNSPSNSLPDVCWSSLCLSAFSDAENITAQGLASLEDVWGVFGQLWLVQNSFFTFSKNYTPWSFQFFIPVWNCRDTRNKSNASFTGKPWVYLKGALKFPLSLLFYRFNIHKCFKKASSVILSIPFKIPISLALNVFYFVNIFLRIWVFGLDKQIQPTAGRVLSFSIFCAHITFLILYACQCHQDQKDLSAGWHMMIHIITMTLHCLTLNLLSINCLFFFF